MIGHIGIPSAPGPLGAESFTVLLYLHSFIFIVVHIYVHKYVIEVTGWSIMNLTVMVLMIFRWVLHRRSSWISEVQMSLE